MQKIIRGLIAAALSTAGVGAQAADRCWDAPDAAAAQVRQMQTMLMVATLRCRAAGIDIVANYDGFVSRQDRRIAFANAAIRRHFASQADYDRFTTSLANSFGDDETAPASCARAAALADVAAGGKVGSAAATLAPASLPGGACAEPAAMPARAVPAPVLARAEPAGMPPPILPIATPEPQEVATALPADVTAALTVMARFRDAEAVPQAAAPTQVAAVLH